MNKSHNPVKNIMHPNSIKMSKNPHKNLAIQNAGEDMNQCELSSIAGGNAKCMAKLADT